MILKVILVFVCALALHTARNKAMRDRSAMWVVFLGPPGCGKGTQAEILISRGFVAVCAGELLRASADRVLSDGTTIGNAMKSGSLLPDSVTIELIKEKVACISSDNIIFDGFPRTVAQAEALHAMACEFGLGGIDCVINFVMDDDVIVKRITGRFKCSKCGKIYNKFFCKTSTTGVCDLCGCQEFEHRADDNEETLRKRLAEYHDKTHHLVDFYKKSAILYDVGANSPVGDVTLAIERIVNIS